MSDADLDNALRGLDQKVWLTPKACAARAGTTVDPVRRALKRLYNGCVVERRRAHHDARRIYYRSRQQSLIGLE